MVSCAPAANGVVDVMSEISTVREMSGELATILSVAHESLARLYLQSPAGEEWLERLNAKIKGKRNREEVSAQELEAFFRFTPEDVWLVWVPVAKYVDTKGPRSQDWATLLKNRSIMIIGRYIKLLTPGATIAPSISVGARAREFMLSSCPHYSGWPALAKHLEVPRLGAEWASEPGCFDSPIVEHKVAWFALLKRLGWMEAEVLSNSDADLYTKGPRGDDAKRTERETSSVTEMDEVADGNAQLGEQSEGPSPPAAHGGVELGTGNAQEWYDAGFRETKTLESKSAPMELGVEFAEFGEPGWVAEESIGNIQEAEQEVRNFDHETIMLIRHRIDATMPGFAEFVSDEAIRIATLGPLGRARYMIEELEAMCARADEVALREANKKMAATACLESLREQLQRAEQERMFLEGLKAENRESLRGVSVSKKELVAKATGRNGGGAVNAGAKRALPALFNVNMDAYKRH